MGSFNERHAFDPLDLEIIDRVYEVACAHLEAANLYCDPEKSPEEKDALRKRVFDFAGTGSFDFDTLCDKVLASMAELEIRSRRAA